MLGFAQSMKNGSLGKEADAEPKTKDGRSTQGIGTDKGPLMTMVGDGRRIGVCKREKNSQPGRRGRMGLYMVPPFRQ